MINVLIPTYKRSHRVPGIVNNVLASSQLVDRIVFCVEEDDTATIDAVKSVHETCPKAMFVVNNRSRNYAGAINSAWSARKSIPAKYWFAGADDLDFQPGWDTEAVGKFNGWFGVVGTNDLLNPYVQQGSHATHYLVAADYLEKIGGVVDEGRGSFLYEGYVHNYTDTEFIGTAKMRAKFRPCLSSIVRHLHWSTGATPIDETVEKANAGYAADSELYDSRRDLWFNISR